ncbi:hypothetical protein [Rossellomorea sp. BNER]|uniref:hypothetical protein n=1 Tax=Rossellomorea sp. BNER TaxID=2962031 RepID=UPI003AF2FE3F
MANTNRHLPLTHRATPFSFLEVGVFCWEMIKYKVTFSSNEVAEVFILSAMLLLNTCKTKVATGENHFMRVLE